MQVDLTIKSGVLISCLLKNMADLFLSFCKITVLCLSSILWWKPIISPGKNNSTFWLRHIWSLPTTYNLTYQFWGLGLPLPSNGGSGDPNYSTAVHHLKAPFIVETLVIEYTEGIDGIKPHEAREVVAEWGMPKYKYHQIRVRHSKQHMGKYNPTKN